MKLPNKQISRGMQRSNLLIRDDPNKPALIAIKTTHDWSRRTRRRWDCREAGDHQCLKYSLPSPEIHVKLVSVIPFKGGNGSLSLLLGNAYVENTFFFRFFFLVVLVLTIQIELMRLFNGHHVWAYDPHVCAKRQKALCHQLSALALCNSHSCLG